MDATPADLVEFCTREWPRLVGSLTLYLGDRAVAEELAQETLVRVARDWPRVRALGSAGGWAHRVAMNLAASQRRRERAARRAATRLGNTSPTENGDDDIAARVAIRDAVGKLPERQRRALVLRYYADLSVRDAAQAMNVPENTLKTLTRAAIATLRSAGLVEADSMEPNDVG